MPEVKARRPSPLQHSILIMLAALNEVGSGPVTMQELKHGLELVDYPKVHSYNLRVSCQRMAKSGWLRTLQTPDLQLAVELTDAGRELAVPLLSAEREEFRRR